jgi:hypothetical protein
MNESEIVRIAVRASMATLFAALACFMTLFLVAAAMSSDINLPGVRVNDVVGPGGGGD